MHFIKLYQPLIGTKASFLQSFEGDAMHANASLFWSKLDDASIVFFILTIAVAIGVAVIIMYLLIISQDVIICLSIGGVFLL